MTNEEIEFLVESNAIEQEYSIIALEDAKEAWEYAKNNFPLQVNGETLAEPCLNYVLKIHYLLMKRLNPRIAGRFRRCDVIIGGRVVKYEDDIKLQRQVLNAVGRIDANAELLSRPEMEYANKENILTEFCKSSHVFFELVHPFEDGNGRTGRILYNVHRLKSGLPIHTIHTGKEQHEYYKWFDTYSFKSWAFL